MSRFLQGHVLVLHASESRTIFRWKADISVPDSICLHIARYFHGNIFKLDQELAFSGPVASFAVVLGQLSLQLWVLPDLNLWWPKSNCLTISTLDTAFSPQGVGIATVDNIVMVSQTPYKSLFTRYEEHGHVYLVGVYTVHSITYRVYKKNVSGNHSRNYGSIFNFVIFMTYFIFMIYWKRNWVSSTFIAKVIGYVS